MKKASYFLLALLLSCKGTTELPFHKFNEVGESLSVNKMNSTGNRILHIGKDTTLYNIHSTDNNVPYEYFYQPFVFIVDHKDTLADRIKAIPFKILVDTTSSVNIPFYPEIPQDIPGDQISEWFDKNKKMVNAYPVYIWNPTDKITSIPVQGAVTEAIQEAKDEQGNWRPIEFWVSGFCGNGYWDYILMPNYYVVIGILKYTGEFQTELRVKFRRGNQVFYSKPFKGSINKEQFNPEEHFHDPYNYLEFE